MNKTTLLKNMIQSNELEFIMEAHNGLSAKIVEETGFKGIWASGLSISASLGVRDNNEASWTQVLEVVEFMSDATNIPILLDGDTGYGNFNNAMRLVRKLEQRGVAGVCIEDKLFPKTNSFISGETQPLADIDEFSGKIKACKDAQTDDDFNIIARVEDFIAGWGLSEALKRAEAYRVAGADAILMHSKKSDPSDIEIFMKEWGDRHPIVIVPTKYFSTPTEVFQNLGVSMVIWANHNIRTAISAMKKTSQQIYENQNLFKTEGNIVPVSEVFRLQGAEELKKHEGKYLPNNEIDVSAIILAASQGERLGALTKNVPKALINVGDKSILDSTVDNLNSFKIKDISIVRGFAKEKINLANASFIDNDEYQSTKELYSLYLAKEKIQKDTLIIYGDIVFKNYILNDLLNDTNDITIVVDADIQQTDEYCDFVKTSEPYSIQHYNESVNFIEMSNNMSLENKNGEFIGLWKVNQKGADKLKTALDTLSKESNFKEMRMADLFNHLAKSTNISVRYIKGSWLDIDDVIDLQKIGAFNG